jgi:hypothetical protein
MARPQVADGGDALQVWRVAVNILNRQSRTAYKGGPPAWRLGVRLTTNRKKYTCYERSQEASDLDGMDWIDLAEDMNQWRALVNTVMNLQVP